MYVLLSKGLISGWEIDRGLIICFFWILCVLLCNVKESNNNKKFNVM